MTPRTSFLRILPACLLAALLAACAHSSVDRKKEADARMQMGITYLDQRNLPMAMRELTRASELDPANPEIDMMLGMAYKARGDLPKAEEYLRTAIEKNPDYADAHNNLGAVFAEQKRWKEAVREFEAAGSNVLYGTPEIAYFNLGEAYRMQNDPARAEEAYRKSLRASDRYAPAYIGLAAVLGGRGKWEDAAGVLSQCVGRIPDYAPCWMELGRVNVRLSRTAEARKDFNTVLSVSSDPELRKQASGYLSILPQEKR